MLANWKKRVFPLNRRQAVFAMLLCLVLAVNAVPALRASALYLITDGEATDCDGEELRTVAEQIRSLATADGNVLLVNIHIATAADMRPLLFPEPSEEHYANRYASLLYDCSSTMPEPFHAAIRELKGAGALPPFRGHCFNASAAELVSALNIGSISVKTE